MKLIIKYSAKKTLEEIAFFIEQYNTTGAGSRFLDSFIQTIKKYAVEGVLYKLCQHESLAQHNFSCLFIDKWIIVFKIKGNSFIVYRIIWGPALH